MEIIKIYSLHLKYTQCGEYLIKHKERSRPTYLENICTPYGGDPPVLVYRKEITVVMTLNTYNEPLERRALSPRDIELPPKYVCSSVFMRVCSSHIKIKLTVLLNAKEIL